MFNRHNRDSREPNQATVVLCFCGENCELADVFYDCGSFGLNDYPCSLCMPCCSDYSDLTNHPVAFGYAFSQTLFSLLSPFWTEKIHALASCVDYDFRLYNRFTRNKTRPTQTHRFELWCKAVKQQGGQQKSTHIRFLDFIMRIWKKSIVSMIYSCH